MNTHNIKRALLQQSIFHPEALFVEITVGLRDELVELIDRWEDYGDGVKKVLDEKCASDERHCGCVPVLRAEIEHQKTIIDNANKEKSCYQEALILITTLLEDRSFVKQIAMEALDQWTQRRIDAVKYWVNKFSTLEEENKQLNVALRWTSVNEQAFPSKNGIIVCYDGQKYCAFYFNEFTVELPIGTTHYYQVPEFTEVNHESNAENQP